MSLTKVNFILLMLLNGAILFLFVNFTQLSQKNSFDSQRIDQLERRPIVDVNDFEFPQAGESGRAVDTSFQIEPTRIAQTPLPTATTKPTPAPTNVSAPKSAQITYIPLFGGESRTTDTNWTNVAGSDVQLKISDYGSNPYATWDAITWVVGGSGDVTLRLFDVTNGVGVSGSEISVSSAQPTLVSSGRLSFFTGNNTYRVQMKSQTSSPVQFDFGRIKIVY